MCCPSTKPPPACCWRATAPYARLWRRRAVCRAAGLYSAFGVIHQRPEGRQTHVVGGLLAIKTSIDAGCSARFEIDRGAGGGSGRHTSGAQRQPHGWAGIRGSSVLQRAGVGVDAGRRGNGEINRRKYVGGNTFHFVIARNEAIPVCLARLHSHIAEQTGIASSPTFLGAGSKPPRNDKFFCEN